jgi:hypothetical protein
MRIWLACQLLLVATVLGGAFGCGQNIDGFTYQPVSGRVTVNGQPQTGLKVVFVPQHGRLESGSPSVGVTNEEGLYELKTLDGLTGAAVGDHLVSISSEEIDPDTQAVVRSERIPARYNANTELRFSVPPNGTEQADFSIALR